MKSKSKESRHPWRENLEATSMAIVVALLFKTFILEVSKIPSGSMQPTLMGNAQARIYDRVLVDKLSFQFRDPERFEIVVFRHPIERSRVMVKRLFGMPEEDLRIRNGDVWTRKGPEAEWAVQRRPASVMKESWKRLDPESPKRSSWGVGSGGESWRISGRDIRARGDGRARFRPGKTSITDHYRDGYPESLADLIPIRDPGLTDQNDVGDLRVEGRVRALRGTERVVIELTEGNRIYEFRLQGPAAPEGAAAEIRVRDGSGGVRRPERVEQAAYGRLPEDELVRFAVENLDDRLRLELDGEVVLELDVEPAKEQQSTVSIAVRGDGADLEDLMVYRDIHYLPQGMPAVVTIPAGHYFMLGDNTQDSADSRDWREITYAWHRPDGETVRWRGNARRGGRDKGGWENPLWGLGDGGRPWYGFKDEWGDRHWFPAEESQPGFVEEHAPLVPRHLIQGRAVAIFWPILPHKGIWRLGWLH